MHTCLPLSVLHDKGMWQHPTPWLHSFRRRRQRLGDRRTDALGCSGVGRLVIISLAGVCGSTLQQSAKAS